MTKDEIIEKIIENLKNVFDPEIPANIYDLGLIYKIDLTDEGLVAIEMTLTSPGCPVADQLVEDVRCSGLGLEGVKDVAVELTFDPPWEPSMMSETARLETGFFDMEDIDDLEY